MKGLGNYEVHEQFATGVSAVNLAADPAAMQKLSVLDAPTNKTDGEHGSQHLLEHG